MPRKNDAAPALFDPEGKSRLPVTIYDRLAPSNPYASVSWFRALDLANQGLLAHTLIAEGLMTFDPEDRWFQAVKALEAKGIRKGVTARELARVLNCAPATAKRHMLIGEAHIYSVFGLNISFATGNGIWRIATRDEAAAKYARMGKEIKAKFQRMRMYAPHMAALGAQPDPVPMELLLPAPKPRRKKGGAGHDHAAD